jgi:hypothetical protein
MVNSKTGIPGSALGRPGRAKARGVGALEKAATLARDPA